MEGTEGQGTWVQQHVGVVMAFGARVLGSEAERRATRLKDRGLGTSTTVTSVAGREAVTGSLAIPE